MCVCVCVCVCHLIVINARHIMLYLVLVFRFRLVYVLMMKRLHSLSLSLMSAVSGLAALSEVEAAVGAAGPQTWAVGAVGVPRMIKVDLHSVK